MVIDAAEFVELLYQLTASFGVLVALELELIEIDGGNADDKDSGCELFVS